MATHARSKLLIYLNPNTNLMKKLFWLMAAVVFTACEKSTTNPDPNPGTSYNSGVYVTSEGAFPNGSGALSYFNPQSNVFVGNLFEQVNGRPLGNTTQAMSSWQNTGLIVVNNANKIELVDLTTFQATGEITGLQLPSRIAVSGNKAYVTEWVSFGGNGRLSIIDLASKNIVKTLATGPFPDAIIAHAGKIYVANSNGSEVLVLDTQSDNYSDTIAVGDWPNSFAVDALNQLWVLCGGIPSFMGTATEGSLWLMDPLMPFHIDFGVDEGLNDLCASSDGQVLYYSRQGKVYAQPISLTTASNQVVVDRNVYAMGFDPAGQYFYATDAGDFNSAGKLLRYNTSFQIIDSFATGVAPGSLYFK